MTQMFTGKNPSQILPTPLPYFVFHYIWLEKHMQPSRYLQNFLSKIDFQHQFASIAAF